MNVEFVNYPTREWSLDTETMKLGEIEQNLGAIAQDVQFYLSVERYKYPIMGNNMGIELEDLIGMDDAYVRANVKNRIKDALSVDDRITAVSSFAFENPTPDSLVVSFVVETILGDIQMTTNIIS
jgi:hypothetical protein